MPPVLSSSVPETLHRPASCGGCCARGATRSTCAGVPLRSRRVSSVFASATSSSSPEKGNDAPIKYSLPARLYRFGTGQAGLFTGAGPGVNPFKSIVEGARQGASALLEPVETRQPTDPSPGLINDDFKPTQTRTFTAWDYTSLWIGLVVGCRWGIAPPCVFRCCFALRSAAFERPTEPVLCLT